MEQYCTMQKYLYALVATMFFNVMNGMDITLEHATSRTYLDALPDDIAHLLMDYGIEENIKHCLTFSHGITHSATHIKAMECIRGAINASASWQQLLDNLSNTLKTLSHDQGAFLGGESSKAYKQLYEKIEEIMGPLRNDLRSDILLIDGIESKLKAKAGCTSKLSLIFPEKSSFFKHLSGPVQEFLGKMFKSSDCETTLELDVNDELKNINRATKLDDELGNLTNQERSELKDYLFLRYLCLKQLHLVLLKGLIRIRNLAAINAIIVIVSFLATGIMLVGTLIEFYKETFLEHHSIISMVDRVIMKPINNYISTYIGLRFFSSVFVIALPLTEFFGTVESDKIYFIKLFQAISEKERLLFFSIRTN